MLVSQATFEYSEQYQYHRFPLHKLSPLTSPCQQEFRIKVFFSGMRPRTFCLFPGKLSPITFLFCSHSSMWVRGYVSHICVLKIPLLEAQTCKNRFNPLSPGEKLYFSKMITVNQNTTSNIPVERYCLGYVPNHHNRRTRCHKLNWGFRKEKKWKRSKISYSLYQVPIMGSYILGIPLDNSLICISGCGDF